jgi:hypothetical protein
LLIDFKYLRYGSVSFTLPNLVTSIISRLSSRNDLKRVETFIASNVNNLGVATEAFQKAIENINANIRWTEKNVENIKEWLAQQTDLNK